MPANNQGELNKSKDKWWKIDGMSEKSDHCNGRFVDGILDNPSLAVWKMLNLQVLKKVFSGAPYFWHLPRRKTGARVEHHQ